MRRFVGGILGWLVGVLPLIAVNVAGAMAFLDDETAALAGTGALLGGMLLGGVIAGVFGGRGSPEKSGGAGAALVSGGLAAALYAGTLFALVAGASQIGVAPDVVAAHPIRVGAAILCLGAVLLAVALTAGALAARGPRADAHAALPLRTSNVQPPARQPAPLATHALDGPDFDGYRSADQRYPAPSRPAHPARPAYAPPSRPRYPQPSRPRHDGYPGEHPMEPAFRPAAARAPRPPGQRPPGQRPPSAPPWRRDGR